MAYAASTKGAWALEAACMAYADRFGLLADLESEWELHEPGRVADVHRALPQTAAKAWRFAGEMRWIAEAFSGTGLPAGFHEAAEEIWSRWSRHRDVPPSSIVPVLAELASPGAKRLRRRAGNETLDDRRQVT